MGLIDRLFLDDPTLGVKGMRDELRDQGFEYNDKRIRRLMRKMCLMPIYNKRNLSRLGIAKYIHPYLLRHLKIERHACEYWVNTLKELGIQISMDGKGRATDNANIDRFLGTLKRKYVYLNPANDGLDLYEGTSKFIEKYNNRLHQGIDREKPIDHYLKAA